MHQGPLRIQDYTADITLALPAALATAKTTLAAQISSFNGSFSANCTAQAARASLTAELGIRQAIGTFLTQVQAGAVPASAATALAALNQQRESLLSKIQITGATQAEAEAIKAGFPAGAFTALVESHASLVAAKRASTLASQFTTNGLAAENRRLIDRRTAQLATLAQAGASSAVSI